jgi:hypothetical protein
MIRIILPAEECLEFPFPRFFGEDGVLMLDFLFFVLVRVECHQLIEIAARLQEFLETVAFTPESFQIFQNLRCPIRVVPDIRFLRFSGEMSDFELFLR